MDTSRFGRVNEEPLTAGQYYLHRFYKYQPDLNPEVRAQRRILYR